MWSDAAADVYKQSMTAKKIRNDDKFIILTVKQIIPQGVQSQNKYWLSYLYLTCGNVNLAYINWSLNKEN